MPSQAIPPIPAFVSVGPQQTDPGCVNGRALIFAAVVAGAGLTSSAAYFNGTHAQALYNAEAQKSRIQKSAYSVPPGPRVITYVRGAPQQIDLTQQPFYDLPQPGPLVGAAHRLVSAAPQQVDLTQQPFYDAPIPLTQGAVPGVGVTYGMHAGVLYNAESLKTQVWPSVMAGSTPPVVTPAATMVYGSHATALYNAETSKTKIWTSVSSPGSGWLVTYVSAMPDVSEYPTIQGFTTPLARPSAGGPSLGTVIRVGQQTYVDPPSRVFAAAIVGSTPRVGTFFATYQVDTTQLQAFYDAPQVGQTLATGAVPKFVLVSPQFADLVQQVLWEPLPGQVLLTGTVSKVVSVAPQLLDVTLQAFFDAPQTGPLKGPVPPLVQAAPQQVDLTLQAVFSEPLIIGQGKLGVFVNVPPQQYDYTLPASVFEPLVVKISYVLRAAQRLELTDYGKRITLSISS